MESTSLTDRLVAYATYPVTFTNWESLRTDQLQVLVRAP